MGHPVRPFVKKHALLCSSLHLPPTGATGAFATGAFALGYCSISSTFYP